MGTAKSSSSLAQSKPKSSSPSSIVAEGKNLNREDRNPPPILFGRGVRSGLGVRRFGTVYPRYKALVQESADCVMLWAAASSPRPAAQAPWEAPRSILRASEDYLELLVVAVPAFAVEGFSPWLEAVECLSVKHLIFVSDFSAPFAFLVFVV